MAERESTNRREPVKFGTFGGVFTPNVLTIFGVILFLRSGWVVGNAGLREALVMLCIANTITLLTSLSLSAVATNIRVKGGGAYFLVSRSLGLEVGGAVGLPLFLAQGVSVAFYIVGFVESLRFLFPELPPRAVATGVLAVLFVIAWVGADLAIKAQYVIMGALGLSLAAFFAGWSPVADVSLNLEPAYTGEHSFWTVFAIFFPAVTGILSGLSMSGDLRNPTRSIPRGTLSAVLFTWLVYAAHMCWLALHAPREALVGNALVMREIAVVPSLVFVGLWAATLSSALASLLAAPRTLQALARDSVLPGFLGKGVGASDEPKLALVLATALAGSCLLIGELDLIAPIITMFFLAAYGTVNLVAGLSRLVSNPSYRPTFRLHWAPSLLGAFGCALVMFILNPVATIGAVVVIAGIYALLKRRQYETAWGDERSGMWFALARLGLLKLAASQQHVRNWRPVLLVLVGNPSTRTALVDLANRLEARRGLLFLAQILTGEWRALLGRQAAAQKAMEEFIQTNRLSAVGKTVLAEDFEHGVSMLLQVVGVGALEPNTVLVGWSDDELKRSHFTAAVRRILGLRRNLLVYAGPKLPPHHLAPVIDVWWRARINGGFMLTLAHLLLEGSGARMREHRIRVRSIVADEAARAPTEAVLRASLEELRIRAEVEVLVSATPPLEVIARASELSDVAFIGLALEEEDPVEHPLATYEPLVARLKGTTLLSKNWHDFHPGE